MKRIILAVLALCGFLVVLLANVTLAEQWLPLAAEMPTARADAGAVLINGKIYLIGGRGLDDDLSDTVDMYDLAANTWGKASVMVRGRWGLTACALDGKIYATGGFRATYVALYDLLQEYDTVTNKWSTKTPMPTARFSLSSSMVNGKMYAIGGLVGEVGEYSPTPAVEEYDPATDTWTKKKNMPTARYGMATCAVDGKIYAIGGSTQYGDPAIPVATVEEYDPATDTWTQKSDMITPRYYLAAGVSAGQIYAIGGSDFTNNPLTTVDLYVPGRDVWMEVMGMPTPRRGLAVIAAEGRIYAIGGYAANNEGLKTVDEYTPENWNFAVSPLGKLAATWGDIKQSR